MGNAAKLYNFPVKLYFSLYNFIEKLYFSKKSLDISEQITIFASVFHSIRFKVNKRFRLTAVSRFLFLQVHLQFLAIVQKIEVLQYMNVLHVYKATADKYSVFTVQVVPAKIYLTFCGDVRCDWNWLDLTTSGIFLISRLRAIANLVLSNTVDLDNPLTYQHVIPDSQFPAVHNNVLKTLVILPLLSASCPGHSVSTSNPCRMISGQGYRHRKHRYRILPGYQTHYCCLYPKD